jgi:hypothetical protein
LESFDLAVGAGHEDDVQPVTEAAVSGTTIHSRILHHD